MRRDELCGCWCITCLTAGAFEQRIPADEKAFLPFSFLAIRAECESHIHTHDYVAPLRMISLARFVIIFCFFFSFKRAALEYFTSFFSEAPRVYTVKRFIMFRSTKTPTNGGFTHLAELYFAALLTSRDDKLESLTFSPTFPGKQLFDVRKSLAQLQS